ncbi:hypothetical protein HYU92_00030 [Candidatus Curtissbacteria bacterium]|nr:hypothetical protein [Candidatus Curtissbacteria bacterium]
MKVPKSVAALIEAFEALPGIGPKTAARLTYYLLHAPDALSQKLSDSTRDLKTKTKICSICQNITEIDPCEICEDETRDQSTICVVEDPLDVWAIGYGWNGWPQGNVRRRKLILFKSQFLQSYSVIEANFFR